MYTKIYAIFTTVVKYFILACGISLLLSCNIKLVEHLSNVLTYKERLTTEEVLEIINAFKESKEINT